MPRTDGNDAADWQPDAEFKTLKMRATLLARIRSFFVGRGVLEVDTPHLSRYAATDTQIESFASSFRGPGSAHAVPLYLHTSPEFFMKRLLAAGSGPIYQLSHVFRNGEAGRCHNPEFMMLEWYRPGFEQHALMDEIDALLSQVLEGFIKYQAAQRISYRQWFLRETGLDPWVDDVAAFRAFAAERLATVPVGMNDDGLDTWLALLVTHWLEPRLSGQNVFVFDYPPSQAALARVRTGDIAVAERFELYLGGIELANGFHELGDAAEQQRRFEADNAMRTGAGLVAMPYDKQLIAALAGGLPDCSGVALGVDRLVMQAGGLRDIAAAMPFSFAKA